MKNILLVICGIVALGIGMVGVIVPVLPTTPFVLISAACFGGSSKRLYNRLVNTKYFGEFILNYKNKTGVAKKVKAKAIAFLWTSLVISSLIFSRPLIIGILLIVGIAVTAHILLLKTATK